MFPACVCVSVRVPVSWGCLLIGILAGRDVIAGFGSDDQVISMSDISEAFFKISLDVVFRYSDPSNVFDSKNKLFSRGPERCFR